MQGLTAQLAHFVAGAPALALDAAVRRSVCDGFTDTVSVMLAGSQEPVSALAQRFVQARRSAAREASVLLGRQRAAPRDAAFINATTGHALDYDDVALLGHPSVVLVPALLAEGERLHADGLALMRAYVAGYEVWAELVRRDADLHHLKGWHPTGVFGTVASAAAVAALRGLDAEHAAHALGLAASMAGGLIANFGSMAKPLHAGQASANGIDAVDLAAAGMTSAPDALEHPRGFLAALSPKGAVDRGSAPASFGHELRIARLKLTLKKYPVCFAAHRVADATLDLAHAHDLQAAEVAEVHATVGPAQAAMLRNHAPASAMEAKFSLEFAVASALAVRRLGLAELDDDFVRRADVQALLPRVRIRTVDTACAHESSLAASDRVVIVMRDGTRHDSGEIAGTRGDAQTPLTPGELKAKFMDCCARAPAVAADRLFAALQDLQALDDVNRLAAARSRQSDISATAQLQETNP